MNIYSLLSFFAFIVYLYLGLYAFKMEPKATANRVFLALSICLAVWAFSYTFIYNAPKNNVFWFWSSIAAVGWCTYAGAVLHLALIITHDESASWKKWVYTVLYLPSLVFLSVLYIYILPQEDTVSVGKSIYYTAFTIYYVVYDFLSLALVWRWGKKSQSNREKKQSNIIVSTGVVSLLLGVMIQNILPMIGIRVIPLIAQITLLIWAYGMWYAMTNLKFMCLTSCITADELIDKIMDLVILSDSRGKILRVNHKIQQILGYREEELLGKVVGSLVDSTYLNTMEILDFNDGRPSFENQDMYFMTKKAQKVPMRVCLSVIYDKAGDVIGYITVAHDMRNTILLQEEIQERKQAEEKLKFYSMHDITTGLYNRFYFEQHMKRLEEDQAYPVGLAVCDVDALKLVNDTLGHQYGDELLATAAMILKQCFREKGIVCRIGGDEFGILMPNCNARYVEDICSGFKDAIIAYNQKKPDIPLNISIGFEVREDCDISMTDLFKKADEHMYHYKKQHSQNVRKIVIDRLTKALNVMEVTQEEEEWYRLRQLFSYRNE